MPATLTRTTAARGRDTHDLPDLSRYNLGRALARAIELGDKCGRIDGLEGEISQELGRIRGRSASGFYLPLRAPMIASRAGFDVAAGSGGVPNLLAPTVIDVLRSKAVVARLGGQVIDGLKGGKFSLPKRSATVPIAWFSEGSGPAATGEPKLDSQVTLAPKTCGAYVDISAQAFVSIPNCGAVVAEDLIAAVAAEVDRVALVGAGGVTHEPVGLTAHPDVTTVAGAAPSRAFLTSLERTLGDANADVGSIGWAMAPAGRESLRNAPAAVGSSRFTWEDDLPGPLGYPAAATTSLADDALILGNWEDLLLGTWDAIDILTDIYKFSTSGYIRVRALADWDVNVKHGASFVRTTLA